MSSIQLSSARLSLLQNGIDPELDKELEDINNCSIKTIVRELTVGDLMILARYMKFPTNRNDEIIIGAARKIVERFLINHPSFRSQNSDIVCQCIVHYFINHPLEAQSTLTIPKWSANYNISYPLPNINE